MHADADVEAEFWVLSTEEGKNLLSEVTRVRAPGPADLSRWRKAAEPARVSAAIRLVDARRRAKVKFGRADRMWLDPTGVEQSTAEPVAQHKARRFAKAEYVVDLCSGIGGDALAMAAKSRVVAADLDQGMCRRLRWNACVYEVEDRLDVVRSRAEEMPLSQRAFVHVDPDRRAHSSTKARGVGGYAPGLDFLGRLPQRVCGGAIKLGPASDFSAHFTSPPFETEIISLGGECKEATLWFGDLVTCKRRATILPAGVSWTSEDGPEHGRVAAGRVGLWVFDPDPALIRAGLLDGFAAVHGLERCAPTVDYLTADTLVSSPFLTAFEVEDVLPLDVKVLKQHLSKQDVGTLEIKTRGIDTKPEELRGRLKLSGCGTKTLLLFGGRDLVSKSVVARRHLEPRAERP